MVTETKDSRTTRKQFEPKYFYRGLCSAILVILATGMFAFVWIRFVRVHNQTDHLTGPGNIGMATFLYALLFILLGRFIGAFKIGVERKASIMASVSLTLFILDIIEIFLSMAITGKVGFFKNFLQEYAILFLVQFILLDLLVIPMVNIYRKVFPPLRLLEVYGERHNGLYSKLSGIPYKYHITETIHYREGIDTIREKIHQVDAVVVSDIPSHEKNQIQKVCVDLDKRVYFVPKISDIIVRYSEELNLIDTPLYMRRKVGITWWRGIVKRTFDILVSIVSILLLSPILLITAIAIKLEDHGPVFFRQERVTRDGKIFHATMSHPMRKCLDFA